MKLTVILLGVISYSVNIAQEQGAAKDLSLLNWLAGTWEQKRDGNIMREKWEEISENTLEGWAIVSKAGSSEPEFSESLRLLCMKGEIFYLAKVDENDLPVSFKLTSFDNDIFIFENPQHDFPQRITYYRKSTDSMTVRVESYGNPDARYFELFYERIK